MDASFASRLEVWADAYGVTSALEAPVATSRVPGVCCVGLAFRGVRVVAAVASEADARAARAAYAGAPHAEVRVARDLLALPRCDLVLSYDTLSRAADWRAELAALAARAQRVLVVVVPHPRAGIDRITRGVLPAVCRTEVLAPALWEVGRVREHVYLDGDFPGRGALGSIASALSARLDAHLARLHAFVVDTTPRTPQARRRLPTA